MIILHIQTSLSSSMWQSSSLVVIYKQYNESNDFSQFKEGDQLTLLEPNYRDVDFSWKGKVCSVFWLGENTVLDLDV